MADEVERVAGHLPAVKAGGMRITQHKTPNTERAAKDPVEVIGLSNPAPNVQSEVVEKSTGNNQRSDHVADSAHQHKPPVAVAHKPVNNIQQPRK